MARSESMKRLVELASRQDLKQFEHAWAEALAGDAADLEGLLEAVSVLESQGQFGKASLHLQSLLKLYVNEEGSESDAMIVLRRLAKISPREPKVRQQMIAVLRRQHGDHPGFDTLLRHSQLENDMETIKALDRFESYLLFKPGSYVEHPAGWGVGVVKAIDSDDASVVIDFEEAKNHELDLEMACRITRHLDADHFKALRFDRRDQLLDMVEKRRADLVKCIVNGRDRTTTVRDVRDLLTDGIIPAKEWSRWWTKARADLKRDSNVKLGTGNNPVIEVSRRTLAFEDTVIVNLRHLGSLPKKIKYMRELFADLEAHPEMQSALVMAAGVLAKTAGSVRQKYPGATLSLALMLERVAATVGEYTIPDDLQVESVLTDPWKILDVIGTVPIAADRKDILERVKGRFPEAWPDVVEKAFYLGESDICDLCLREFQSADAWDRMVRVSEDVLARFRDHRGSFLWYVKMTLKGSLPAILPSPGLTPLLEKTFLLHSHCTNIFLQTEDAEIRKECRAIERFLTARNSEFVRTTLERCSIEDATDFYNMVRGSRSIPDDVKDSLVATILRTRPEVAKFRVEREEREIAESGMTAIDEAVIYVTAAGYARFQEEYLRLVNDEIPKTQAEKQYAASFGDLSENAEYTAAIEKLGMLSQRIEEMETALAKARVIDEAAVTNETVAVGCRVTARNSDTGQIEHYTLLGPWDVDMDKRIISYMSPLGRAFLGKSVGNEVTVTLPAGTTPFAVIEIAVATELLAGAANEG